MEVSDWNETSELKYLTHWMPLPSPPDDVAAPAEQPATTEAATPKGAATTEAATPKGAATTEAATPKGAATTGAPLGGVYAELLTDEQVDALIATKHFREGYELTASVKVLINWYLLGLRDGERAHGITQQCDAP